MLGLMLQEKSLGGLCRRFVQLFLVGNDVVSVAEAAEKLSDPGDVSVCVCAFPSVSEVSVDSIGVRVFHLCPAGFVSVRQFHQCLSVLSVCLSAS